MALGQACGTYRIRYAGKIDSNIHQILEIKVPSIPLLHGYEKPQAARAFVLAESHGDSIVVETVSRLTSTLFDDPNNYLSIYKKIRDNLPIRFVVSAWNNRKEITVLIPWEKIVITSIEDDKSGNLFQIDLGLNRVVN